MAGNPLKLYTAIQAQKRRKKRRALSRQTVGVRAFRSNSTVPPVVPTQSHYRRFADTYIEAPDGTVQIWNGIDKPLRFDPSVGVTETAGVKPPLAQPAMTGTGSGNIVGTFQCYVRFVDRSGNLSSLSPISDPYVTNSTTFATITGATNASPIVLTLSAAPGWGTGQIIKVTGVLGNLAANGIFQVIMQTPTTAALYLGGGVASLGSGTYNSGGTATTGVQQITYSNVAVSTETKVTRRQILRNKDGDTSVFFIDIDTTDLTSTTFNSQTDDASLVTDVSLTDVNGETLVDKSIPLNSKKFVAPCLGRVFAAGNENYSEGAVVVTNGSKGVTGLGTEWGQLTFPGRFLEVVGGDKRYTIDGVQSQTSLTLTEVYTGNTDQYAYYSITNGPAERFTIYWTPPSQPEAWPLTNSLPLAKDPGAGEITGLMQHHAWLYILFENRIYRFSFVEDPLNDGEAVLAASRGCINNRSWVKVDNVVYGMDTLGFWQFVGNDLIDISTPAVNDLFRNRQSGPYKINWAARKSFHAVYDPGETTVRWFVVLAGGYAPYHAVCYSIRLKRWWIEMYRFPIGASCLGRLNGKPQVFLGTDAKRIMALHQSTLDAVDPTVGTVQGTVTSSGYDWIIDSNATFQTGLAGQEIVIIGGTGKWQSRRIVSQSGTRLNFDRPWSTRPDTTSTYQLGGIQWKWRSGWQQFVEGQTEMQRALSVQFSPTTTSTPIYARVYLDMSKTAKDDFTPVHTLADGNGMAVLMNDPATDISIDSTKSNGYVRQRIPGMREFATDGPRFISIELDGCTNADQLNILNLSLDEIE